MNQHNGNDGNARSHDEQVQPSMRTQLLLAAADGELSNEDARMLDAHLAAHPDDQKIIAFEKQLRASVAASATAAGPSDDLRQRIAQMCVGAEHGHAAIPFEDAPSASSQSRSNGTMRWLAIAAMVAVVASIVFITIQYGANRRQSEIAVQPSHRTALVNFVSNQHEECELHADMIGSKLHINSLDEAPNAFRDVLGKEPDLGALAHSGLRFLGAGPCAVPGRGHSVHMVFDAGGDAGIAADDSGRTSLVSVFIQDDTGELNIESNKTYRLVPAGGGDSTVSPDDSAVEIYLWKAGGFIYFLSSTSAPAMDKVRDALGASEPSGTL